MLQISHLLALADTFEEYEGLSDTTLSFRIFGDSKKLGALRGEADITTGRFNDALKWFDEHWPTDCEWPDGVPRPKVAA